VGFVEVILVAARIVGEVASVDVDDVVCEGADEVDVVTDENQRALELIEGVGESIDARHVEVGCGLVHQEQIGRIEQEFYQGEAAFFATAEDADLFEHVVTAEEKAAEQSADELFGDALRRVESLVEHGAGRIEHVDAILGVVAGFDVVAERVRALLRSEDASENFQQSGFASAVWSDEYDALAAFGLEIDAAIDDDVAIGVVNVFEFDDS